MARNKSFDPEVALDDALAVFWQKGYSATSLRDLLDGMAISRQSLYDTYGDKHQLFLLVLDHYNKTIMPLILEPLSSVSASLKDIKNVFKHFQTGILFEKKTGACFMACCAMELAHLDDDVKTRLQTYMKIIENVFLNAIKNARKSGTINTKLSARAQARYLSSSMYGLGILARTGSSEKSIKDITNVILSSLHN